MTASTRQLLHSLFWAAAVLVAFVAGEMAGLSVSRPGGTCEIPQLTDDGHELELPRVTGASSSESTLPAILYALDQNERGQWFNPVHPLTKEPAVTITRVFTTARGDRYEGRTFNVHAP